MKSINELDVYIEAFNFSNKIWSLVSQWNFFAKKTIGIQLIRSADSISANIAEGHGRFHFKENLKFCYYARGSFEETKDWIKKSYERKLISVSYKEEIDKFLELFPKRFNSYINYIRSYIKK